MRFLQYLSISFLLFSIIFSACSKKKGDNKPINPRPSIKFNTINQLEFNQFDDSVVMVVFYEDADGDIGYEDADIHSLFVKDSRLQKADSYYVPPLAPPESSVPIQGELNIVLPPLFILSNAASENVTFEIQIKDRAGNMSNLVQSPTVKIVR